MTDKQTSETTSIHEVTQAVGKIANYFGGPAGLVKQTEANERGGAELPDTRTLLSSESKPTLGTTNSSRNDSGKEEGLEENLKKESLNSTLPSYAPEKCITNTSYSEASTSSLGDLQLKKINKKETSLRNDSEVVRLKESLVTGKEIFGSSTSEQEMVAEVEDKVEEVTNEEEVTAAAIKELDQLCRLESSSVDHDVINLIDEDDDNDYGDGFSDNEGPREDDAVSPGSSNGLSDNERNMGTSSDFLRQSSADEMEEGYTEVEREKLVDDWGTETVETEGQVNVLDELEREEEAKEKEVENRDKEMEMEVEYSKEDQKIMEQFQKIAAMEDSASKKKIDHSYHAL